MERKCCLCGDATAQLRRDDGLLFCRPCTQITIRREESEIDGMPSAWRREAQRSASRWYAADADPTHIAIGMEMEMRTLERATTDQDRGLHPMVKALRQIRALGAPCWRQPSHGRATIVTTLEDGEMHAVCADCARDHQINRQIASNKAQRDAMRHGR